MTIYESAKEAAYWWTNKVAEKGKQVQFYTLLYKLIGLQLDYHGKTTLQSTSCLEGILHEAASLCDIDTNLPKSAQNITMKVDMECVTVKEASNEWQEIYTNSLSV